MERDSRESAGSEAEAGDEGDALAGVGAQGGSEEERRVAGFKEPWLAASWLSLVLAAAFALTGNFEGAFVTATLGVLAWFLNVRARLRPEPYEEPEGEADAPPEEDERE